MTKVNNIVSVNAKELFSESDQYISINDKDNNINTTLYIEKLHFVNGNIIVEGWMFGEDSVDLYQNNSIVESKISRTEREDVRLAYSLEDNYLAGVQIEFKYAPKSDYFIKINTKGLYETINITQQQLKNLLNLVPKEDISQSIKINIEVFSNLILSGWCLVGNRPANKFEIITNNGSFEVPHSFFQRLDVKDVYVEAEPMCGFELALPGYIWSENNSSEGVTFSVAVNGCLTIIKDLFLSKEMYIQSLINIFMAPDDEHVQYNRFIAIEHLKHNNILSELPIPIYDKIIHFINKYKLNDYILSRNVHTKSPILESYADISNWAAINHLNELIIEDPTTSNILSKVTDCINVFPRNDSNRFRFIESITPFLCRNDLYYWVNQNIDGTYWDRYENSSSIWAMSLAIPSLIYSNKFERATALLWKISHNISEDWLNTECISYSVRNAGDQLKRSPVEFDNIINFYYAFLGCLDAFKGNWFSRLYDKELINASITMLELYDSFPHYFKKDLINCMIRNYGLCNTFWSKLQETSAESALADMSIARSHWLTVCDEKLFTDDAKKYTSDDCIILINSINYFINKGSVPILFFIRELISNAYTDNNNNLGFVLNNIGEVLFNKSEAEILRIASHQSYFEGLSKNIDVNIDTKINRIVREVQNSPPASMYDLQKNAAALILQIDNSFDELSRSERHSYLLDLQYAATALSVKESNYIGIDILAYCLAKQIDNQHAVRDIILVTENMIKNITQNNRGAYLPAAVESAIMRLIGLKNKSKFLQVFLNELEQQLNKIFPDKCNYIFSQQIEDTNQRYFDDTIILIYSCKKFLTTRVENIRKTWIKDLSRLNIAYLIVTGDGDDTVNQDVLSLNVSDHYESLPEKTIKLFEWIKENTSFRYAYKIDDDCYLNVGEFLTSLNYRQHAYFGRSIYRPVGGTDRLWHQKKSHTERARKSIDKSPEPSTYADGGGGYSLSRQAIIQLCDAKSTENGSKIVSCSLMEDKLVGDLLSIKNIYPCNIGYITYQRRRTFDKARPVGMLDNIFYPSSMSDTTVCHLDEAVPTDISNFSKKRLLAPKKIWPTCVDVNLRINSNQLDVLSNDEKFRTLIQQKLHVISVVRNEILILPHFLDHYRGMGVKSFLIVDNLSNDGTREFLDTQDDVILFSADTEYKSSEFGVMWQQAILGNFCHGKWVLIADADEFLVFRDCDELSLQNLCIDLERDGYECAKTYMIDMYPFDDLREADFRASKPFEVANYFDGEPLRSWLLGAGRFSNATGVTSNLRHRLANTSPPNSFTSQKYALFKHNSWLRLSQGIHDQTGLSVSPDVIWFAHFKYHSDFAQKVEDEISRGQHFGAAQEYRKYKLMIAEASGSFGYQGSTMYHSWKSFENIKYK